MCLKRNEGADEIAWCTRVLPSKPGDLSSISEAYLLEGENLLLKVYTCALYLFACSTLINTKNIFKREPTWLEYSLLIFIQNENTNVYHKDLLH